MTASFQRPLSDNEEVPETFNSLDAAHALPASAGSRHHSSTQGPGSLHPHAAHQTAHSYVRPPARSYLLGRLRRPRRDLQCALPLRHGGGRDLSFVCASGWCIAAHSSNAIVNGPHSHHTLDTDVVWRPALPPSAATCVGSDPELVLPVQWTTSMMSTDASVALRYLRYCEHAVKVKLVCQEITSAWSCISGCLLTCLADD